MGVSGFGGNGVSLAGSDGDSMMGGSGDSATGGGDVSLTGDGGVVSVTVGGGDVDGSDLGEDVEWFGCELVFFPLIKYSINDGVLFPQRRCTVR